MKKTTAIIPLILAFALLFSACSNSAAPDSYGAVAPAPGANGAHRYNTADGYGYLTEYFHNAQSESYLEIDENSRTLVSQTDTMTFSLKVDTAAYSNIERFIQNGSLPPADAVRTEEMVNYFNYESPLTRLDGPFSSYAEIGRSPFDSDKYLAFIRVATDEIDKDELPPSNLTFLIDVSGSMHSYDKLDLLKEAFALLVETLDEDDTVSIVTYASGTQTILDSVRGSDKTKIMRAIDRLKAGGSTAGASGIQKAYKLAEKNFIDGGNNRVILATDGDFNVGISSIDQLEDFISEKKESGVYLSVLGFGMGNIRDDIMETLSAKGNGNYSYINSIQTANKVLVEELASNLFVVADDVKAQITFDSDLVKSYRLIGYENRVMDNEDFDDDTKDAGEVGAGTDVVVLFELELYDEPADGAPLFDLRIRYKNPGESESRLAERTVTTDAITNRNSADFNFASAVATFGHLLRDSDYLGEITLRDIRDLARAGRGEDVDSYRAGFYDLLVAYGSIPFYE